MSSSGHLATPSLSFGDESYRSRHEPVLAASRHGRSRLIRRSLFCADVVGLGLSLGVSTVFLGSLVSVDHSRRTSTVLLLAALSSLLICARFYGLYQRDEERADHSTVDDVISVFHFVTVGVWLLYVTLSIGGAAPQTRPFIGFWALSLALIVLARGVARAVCHRSVTYLQNTVIVGAGEIGQLVARKLLQHKEYGINLVGFLDAEPRELRTELAHVAVLGAPEELPSIIRLLDVERVIVAFSRDSHPQTLDVIRAARDLGVQIDVVPRLFEIHAANANLHTVEGLPLIGLPPVPRGRTQRSMKRLLDIVGAIVLLILTAPLFLVFAIWIRLGTPGPVFFRQRRLGLEMSEFTALKFRTMVVGTDAAEHQRYIEQTMTTNATPQTNGLYKLARTDAITQSGRWLRRTSLDELPQLINVLRGEMSLVGPRPCLEYETRHFAPHHFERFLVPAGITGLWQVTARARATFVEALDLDVAYARGWSLALDLRLLLQTPLQLIRLRGTA